MTSKVKIVDAIVEDVEHKVLVPSDLPEGKGLESAGIVIGPPNLRVRHVVIDPEMVMQRLQHELFVRGVVTYNDARSKRQDVFGALMASLKLDVESIIEAYKET